MAVVIATSIAGKLAEYTVHPILSQIKYLLFSNRNIKILQDTVRDLENKRNDVKLLVDAAKNNVEVIGEEVLAWLQKVDDLKEKADEVLNGSEMRCLFNRCPNLMSRYLLSRRATKQTIEANKLKAEGTFERVSYPPPPMQLLNLTPNVEFETRLSTKKEIKEALKDKEISIIGICGMPGVGKTTLTKEIVNEVKVEKLFEEVAFAVVSSDPDIKKIQDQLAEMLGLTIKEKTNEDARAKRLHQRLEGTDGKSILVILDDVWKGIELGTIGIPSPHGCKGLKIMFTTRTEDTCSEMKVDKKLEIKVLGEKEGWQLFKDMAGISDDGTDVELVSIAKEVAKECRGLPLALVVVGKALKNKKAAHKWRDALQQLQNSRVTNLEGVHNLVYSRIELSYNYLESNEDQELLLLCSLFAEDESIAIENLVIYARGLELFPNTETLNETRDRVYSIVDNLKGYYLLQPGWKEDEVKLHDVIRDFCLQMATKDKCGYLVKHAGLKEWPEFDTDESCSAVSITFDKLDQLPGGLKCRNFKLLRVACRYSGELKSSVEFFEVIKELRVLELKGMNIQIPSSIQLLTGLRTLCLISCEIDSQLSMIGSLKKLEILCFYDSYFGASVPIELANLSNLKSLDLRFQESCPLLPGVLSGMKKLEELYLGNYIPIEGEDQIYIIEELSSLTSLRAFQIFAHDTKILKQILRALPLENLEKFQIIRTARPRSNFTEDCRVTKSLFLYGNGEENLPSCLQPEINSLMKGTYHLQIKKAEVLKNLMSELDGDGFINLKTLEVFSCVDFEYLIDATNFIPSGTFGKLEYLEFRSLPKLIEICNGNIPSGVFKPPLFRNLMIVVVYRCDAIRSLFPKSAAKCLVNLGSLYISFCPMLEEVVSTEGEEVTETCKMLEFPKLKKVSVSYLRRFKSFTSQSNSGVVCQTLFNQVTVPNMEDLRVYGLDCIVKLFGVCFKLLTIAESDSIQLLQNLHFLIVRGCNALEVLFDFRGLKVTNDAEINVLGRLKTMILRSLPELVQITRTVPKGICVFQNLTYLTVEDCKSLRYLFSPYIAKSLAALKFLSIQRCEALEEIIGKEEENTSKTRNIVIKPSSNLHHFRQFVSMDAKQNEVIHMLEFPKLKTLFLSYLSSFKSFKSETNNDGILRTLFNQVTFPNMEKLVIKGLQYIVKLVSIMRVENSSKPFQNLERLEVEDCEALEVLFDFECLIVTKDHAQSILGRLRSLELKSLDKLVHITRMVPKGIHVLENLTSLVVERCGSLKYLFSPSMANSLAALEILKVLDCESIEQIVGKEEEGTSETTVVEGMKIKFVFPNLNYLLLKNLPRIQMFCSRNHELAFPLVKDLTIENCPMMK